MNGDLRPGIIFTVTGIVVLAHYVLAPPAMRRVSGRTELLIGIGLLVVGVALLAVGVLSR